MDAHRARITKAYFVSGVILAIGLPIAIASSVKLIFVGIVIFAFYVFNRLQRNEYLVVWLRKFTPSDEALPIQKHILTFSHGKFNVITLQDQSFPVSYATFYHRWGHLAMIPVALPILFAIPAGLVALAVQALLDTSTEVFVYLFVLLFLVIAVGTTIVLRKFVRKKTPVEIGEAIDIKKIDKIAVKIRSKKGLNPGVVVLSTDDRLWKEAVVSSIKVADAILLDIGEFSENLQWEIQTTLAMVRPEKVVLLLCNDGIRAMETAVVLQRLLGRRPTYEEAAGITVIQYARAVRGFRARAETLKTMRHAFDCLASKVAAARNRQ